MLESLSNTVKCVQVVRLATFLNKDSLIGVSEPAVRRSSIIHKIHVKNTCVEVSYNSFLQY